MTVASRWVVRSGWRKVLERDLQSHVNRVGTDDMRTYGGSFRKSKVSLSKRNLFKKKRWRVGERKAQKIRTL